jgi:MFS family permease
VKRALRRTWRALALNGFWVPLHFQDTALPAIAIPSAVANLVPHDHVRALALVLALMSLLAMIVPPVAGGISDALRRRGVPRRMLIWLGAAIDMGCLVTLANVHGYWPFVTFLLLATLGANISLAAYQAMIPDVVPQEQWGMESGIRNIATLVGVILGLAVAAGTPVPTTFIGVAVAAGVGAVLLLGQPEDAAGEHTEERAHVSDWHDFTIVFIARLFLAFGMALLMTFVWYFFRDILHVRNASHGTAFVGFASLAGAIASGVYLGWLSDRVSRKLVVALCGIPMTLAAAGFAAYPNEHWMYGFAVLFGIGFGGIMSTGWALAIDSVPKLRDVARDLGIWGIAQNFPQVIAPLAGGAILTAYANSEQGYRVLFFAAAACFAAGSTVVLGVGARPVVPWWGTPLRILAAFFVWSLTHAQNRVRSWGRFPAHCGGSLIVANHQIEIDLMEPMATFVLTAGWRTPVLTASAKLMYEPGFLAMRLPRLRRLLHGANFGWLFEGLGLLPLENELHSRSIARWAWAVERRHGVLKLSEVFKPAFMQESGLPDLTTRELFSTRWFARAQQVTARLSDLQVAYRKEEFDDMRAGVEQDMERIERALARGASFFVTPEGDYPASGKMLPFRGIWPRLHPRVKRVFLCAVAYDPFRGRRLSQLYRIVELRDRDRVVEELKAARPVTTSALLAPWLLDQGGVFTLADALAAARRLLADLPMSLFVDPELRGTPERCVREALAGLCGLAIVSKRTNGFMLTDNRQHPDFPGSDVLEFEANVLGETIAAVRETSGPTTLGRLTG